MAVATRIRWQVVFVAATLNLIAAQSAFAALDRVADFALLDNYGEFHQLSRYQHRKALVLMSFDESCAANEDFLLAFVAMKEKYQTDNIDFYLLDSQNRDREQLEANAIPVLGDNGQLVSESLGIQYSGEVLVFNPQRLSLYYRGPLGDQLEATLDEVRSSSNVTDTRSVETSGCAINYPQRDLSQQSPPDYIADVAPIIIEHCAECHRQGGVGPFALDSYIMLLGWSPMIREVVLNKRMPPAQVDPYIGHSDNARYLADEELQTLVHWIDARAPRGDPAIDPLEEFSFDSTQEWELGEPDYVVVGPQHDVAATGVMDYLYKNIDLPFEEDKWIRAVQYKAGDESVLHHLMTFVTAPEEDFWGAEKDQETVTRRFVEGYAPGNSPAVEFPTGTGVFVPQGHRLSMQFHYVTNGQTTTDQTRLGLYFSEEAGLKERLTQAVSTRFVLPPNDPNFDLQAEYTFDEDVVISGVRARMNYRGKKMRFAVQRRDGSVENLFSVPAYNYGWQPNYLLAQPAVVEAGSKVMVIGALDNSVSNPSNPDPEKEVRFGLNSWDEMFTGYFTFHRAAD